MDCLIDLKRIEVNLKWFSVDVIVYFGSIKMINFKYEKYFKNTFFLDDL